MDECAAGQATIQGALGSEGLLVLVGGEMLSPNIHFYRVMMKAFCALLLTGLVMACGQHNRSKPSGGRDRGVLIKSASAAIWLPRTKLPSAIAHSLALKDLAPMLEGPAFGQMQWDDPGRRVRVLVDDDIQERTVSFEYETDVTALELLTVIAIKGKCQVVVEESRIVFMDADS